MRIIAKFMLCLALILGLSSWAKLAPPGMTEFNKKCPTPKLCDKLYEEVKSCKSGKKSACDRFVRNYERALPEYDCQRSFDSTDIEKHIVPAIWLCDTHEYFLEELSKMKSQKARRLYGSKKLRDTLDGALAETHFEKSQRVERNLNK